jgi:hypothetical protein
MDWNQEITNLTGDPLSGDFLGEFYSIGSQDPRFFLIDS